MKGCCMIVVHLVYNYYYSRVTNLERSSNLICRPTTVTHPKVNLTTVKKTLMMGKTKLMVEMILTAQSKLKTPTHEKT
jgi:hypothetical protein